MEDVGSAIRCPDRVSNQAFSEDMSKSSLLHYPSFRGCTMTCKSRGTGFESRAQPVGPYTHTTGLKLRCQTPNKQATNICEPLRIISVKYSFILPDDG